jgi:sigma-B regulation protein RsbU (phosphoserine phosphatase)
MGMFVTLLYLVLDPRERNITFVNAGHLPPLVWNCEADRLRVLDQSGGPPIGIVTGRSYPCSRVELASGDCLVLATDGLTEAKGPAGDRLGWERLKAVLRQGSSCVDDVFDRINLDLKRFVGNEPQADDTTIVLVGVEED